MWRTTLSCTALRGWTFAASRCQTHRSNPWELPSCWPSVTSNIWCGYPTQNCVKNSPGMWPKHHTKQNVENILTRSVQHYTCLSKRTQILFQSHILPADTFMFEKTFLKKGGKPVSLSVCRLQREKTSSLFQNYDNWTNQVLDEGAQKYSTETETSWELGSLYEPSFIISIPTWSLRLYLPSGRETVQYFPSTRLAMLYKEPEKNMSPGLSVHNTCYETGSEHCYSCYVNLQLS